MTALRRRIAQRSKEDGFSLIEIQVSLYIFALFGTLVLGFIVSALGVTQSTVQRNDDTNAWANTFATVRQEVMRAEFFTTEPTGTVVELQMSGQEFVRYEFILDDSDQTKNIFTRQYADYPPHLGGEWTQPKILARGFSTGSFEHLNRELTVNIGDDSITVRPLSNYIPTSPGRTDEFINAEYLLSQDVQAAVSKDGSTSDQLLLKLTDDSYVRWTIRGSQLERATSASLDSPWTDVRVIMTNAIGAYFSYEHYATRDITLNVGETSTTFTIPLRAPM